MVANRPAISKVEHDFVALALLGRRNELVDPTITQVLHLRMTRHKAVKLELMSTRRIQVSYAFVLVRYEHALKNKQLDEDLDVDTYLLI